MTRKNNENIVYMQNNVIISQKYPQSFLYRVDVIDNTKIIYLGLINLPSGKLISAKVYGQDIVTISNHKDKIQINRIKIKNQIFHQREFLKDKQFAQRSIQVNIQYQQKQLLSIKNLKYQNQRKNNINQQHKSNINRDNQSKNTNQNQQEGINQNQRQLSLSLQFKCDSLTNRIKYQKKVEVPFQQDDPFKIQSFVTTPPILLNSPTSQDISQIHFSQFYNSNLYYEINDIPELQFFSQKISSQDNKISDNIVVLVSSREILVKKDQNEPLEIDNIQKDKNLPLFNLLKPKIIEQQKLNKCLKNLQEAINDEDNKTPSFGAEDEVVNSKYNQDFIHQTKKQSIVRSTPQIGIINKQRLNKISHKKSVKSIINNNFDYRQSNNPMKNQQKKNQKQQISVLYQTLSKINNIQSQKPNRSLKQQLQKQTHQKKYSILLLDLLKKNPQKFKDCFICYLPQIIKQEQCKQLFENYLRGPNNQHTKNNIYRVYLDLNKILLKNNKNTQDQQYNQLKVNQFIKCLSNFKLKELPIKIIQKFMRISTYQIITIFLPQTYLKNLLIPTLQISQLLLEKYFSIGVNQPLPMNIECIKLDNQIIDITHPRNLLNVLLYINQQIGAEIQDIVVLYLKKMLQHGEECIVRKIVQKEKILDICQINYSVMDDVILSYLEDCFRRVKNKYNKQQQQYLQQNLQRILSPLSLLPTSQKNHTFQILIEYFLSITASFNIKKLFQIRTNKNILEFIKDLLNSNSIQTLLLIDYCKLYRKLWQLQQNNHLQFYTYQLVKICQIVSELFTKQSYIYQSFKLIKPILSIINKSLIAKLLIQYLDGKLLNRLLNHQITKDNFQSYFPQIFSQGSQKNYSKAKKFHKINIRRDTLIIPQHSPNYTCSWKIFQKIYNKHFNKNSQQIKLMFYIDLNLVWQLCKIKVIDQNIFHQFLNDINQYRIKQVSNKRFYTPLQQEFTQVIIKTQNKGKIQTNQCASPVASSQGNEYFLSAQKKTKSLINLNSLKSQEQTTSKSSQKVKLPSLIKKPQRTKSDQKSSSQNSQDSIMSHLKILVDQGSIISLLNDIYKQNPYQKFLRAISLIKQKIIFYHIEQYKILVQANIRQYLSILLNFNIFLIQNNNDCFNLIASKILIEINVQNFWLIYLIIDIMFKKGKYLATMLIQKIIKYQRSDQYVDTIYYLLNGNYKFIINQHFITEMIIQAKNNNLNKIVNTLEKYSQKLI